MMIISSLDLAYWGECGCVRSMREKGRDQESAREGRRKRFSAESNRVMPEAPGPRPGTFAAKVQKIGPQNFFTDKVKPTFWRNGILTFLPKMHISATTTKTVESCIFNRRNFKHTTTGAERALALNFTFFSSDHRGDKWSNQNMHSSFRSSFPPAVSRWAWRSSTWKCNFQRLLPFCR